MEERIINLLRLCMEAKQKGRKIYFDYFGDTIMVFDITSHTFRSAYLDLTDAEQEMSEAEDYIKGLIQ